MSGAAPHRLFVYGTLRDDACVRAVTGRTFPRRPAVLADHRRVAPRDDYPDVVPAAESVVSGDVLSELDAAALAALDAYEDEGRLYERVETTVTCGAERLRCFVYRGRRPPARRPRPASAA